ncbi:MULTISPECIES: hypothetical protein [unclassified Nocardioides]|uniref:hypothetical protein n=1 Tax=unclassified Nocardioides TaxID=2615069 RepID=UPI0030157794
MPAQPYETRLRPATERLDALREAVVEDVDADVGGIGWWDGQVDFRRLAILTEYLIESISGAAAALVNASYEAQQHRESLASEDRWLRSQWRKVQTSRGQLGFFQALSERTAFDERRERSIQLTGEHSIAHQVQCLDRLAACLVIVGAAPVSVKHAGWSGVRDLAKKSKASSTTAKLDPLGTDGRELQDGLFATVLESPKFGPTDWMEWMFALRNADTHRANRLNWNMQVGDLAAEGAMLRPFPRQPDFTDLEALSDTTVDRREGIQQLVLLHRSTSILEGLLDSMVRYVAHIVDALERCWSARRSSPTALIQRGAQWQDLRGTRLRFPGYGDPLATVGDMLAVNPEMAMRLRAARVLDDRLEHWRD